MFSERDQNQVIKWNRTMPYRDQPVELCVQDLVREQVARQPSAPAVCSWDGDFTYRELDDLSTSLAYYLVENGVGPEVMVPLCFDKSRWTVIAMHAVIKAGGVCVNLLPTHPIGRIRAIIEDSNAKIALAAPQHVRLLTELGILNSIIAVQSSLFEGIGDRTTRALPQVLSTNAVSVLYTSGTTGKPKGIVIEHGAFCTASTAFGSKWGLGPGTRVFSFAAHSFDVSIGDMLTTIMRGGCVCIPSEQERLDDVEGAINRMQANYADLTPTLVERLDPRKVPSMKTLIVGGEPCKTAVIEKWAGVLDLIMSYGPAECSINCSGNEPAKVTSHPGDLGIPIGGKLWICDVDNHNWLVPVGGVGELLIEGRILARGYLNDKEKTEAAFIENPAWAKTGKGEPHRRFYKSGDLARYNLDGTIHYVARKDTQVKLYGQRVELGEIEHMVGALFSQAQQVAVDVISREGSEDIKLLAVFLYMKSEVADEDEDDQGFLYPLSDELRSEFINLQEKLAAALPRYMVPSVFITLKRMPFTISRKLDRAQLRKLGSTLSETQLDLYSLADANKRPPSTTMEHKLHSIWADVLRIQTSSIGVDDNFFRLGGDSIVAMKLAGTSRAQGLSLTVTDIFQCPILADMAKLPLTIPIDIRRKKLTYKPYSLLEVPDIDKFINEEVVPKTFTSRENIQDVLPATDFQALSISGALMKARLMLTYFFFEGAGPIHVDLLRRRFSQTISDHNILRTVFVLHGDQYLQVIAKEIPIDFEYHSTQQTLVEATEALRYRDQTSNLEPGNPFIQMTVVERKDISRHRIIVRLSHAQYDGISIDRILKSFVSEENGPSAETTPQFSEYVFNSTARSTSDCYNYWRTLLEGSSMTNIISRSGPHYRRPSETTTVVSRKLPLLSLPSEVLTFATVVKAAWSVVLAKLTGSSDVVFGQIVAGRNPDMDGIESVVGCCLNILPVRVKLHSDWKIIDLLRHVQNQQLSNMPFESLGFREIIRQCTDWPKWTQFSSLVQHQNKGEEKQTSDGEPKYTLGAAGSEGALADLGISSSISNSDIKIDIAAPSNTIVIELMNLLLDELCDTIISWIKDPSLSISLPDNSSSPDLKLPITLAAGHVPESITKHKATSDDIEMRAVLQHAWSQVLGHEVPAGLDSSFFELGGDLISVGQLAILLRYNGFHIDVEDIIDNPSLGGQLALMAKQRSS